jgi:hypothetical protein
LILVLQHHLLSIHVSDQCRSQSERNFDHHRQLVRDEGAEEKARAAGCGASSASASKHDGQIDFQRSRTTVRQASLGAT